MSPDVGQVISELYALPLEDFTRARNARAAALKAADRPADALAIRELRRPPVTIWAINRLAHVDADGLAAFIASVDEIRRTQLHDPRAAGAAVQRQRAALDGLVGHAVPLLAEQGQRATAATQRRIADTLLGAAVDRERAEELTAGRLTEELPAPGFEVLTGTAAGRHLRSVPREESPRAPRGAAAESEARAETGGQHRQDEDRRASAERKRERRAAERQTQAAQKVERRRREAEERRAKAEQERERRRHEAEERQRQAAEHQAVIVGLEREADQLASQLAAVRERLRAARRAAEPRRPDRTKADTKR